MRYSKTVINKELKSAKGWKRIGKEIVKTFKFPDFVGSIQFVFKTAALAEKQCHHPDILVQWNRVTLRLTTHGEGGLTEKDFRLAKEIDKVKIKKK